MTNITVITIACYYCIRCR